jgi:hypothetical protein
MQRLSLEHSTREGWVVLRELSGHDEESVWGTGTDAAVALLDRLLVETSGAALGPGQAGMLAAPDRDRLLLVVYRETFGSRVESLLSCRDCQARFSLDFSLEALSQSVAADAGAPEVVREAPGVYRLADGRRFRLPTGEDEVVAALQRDEGAARRELLRRCLLEGAASDDPQGVVEAMRAVGPLHDLDVDARCPECGTEQSVRFDLQHFVLGSIREEGRQRALEIHTLARAYRWGLSEILGLTRARRRTFCELLAREPMSRGIDG